MADRVDVAIAGGGVIGSAVAYFLAASEGFDGLIVVLEPDPAYTRGATARSVGGIRHQHTTPENVRIGLFATDFVRRAPELLAVGDDKPDLGFREQGYLMLADPTQASPLADAQHMQAAEGAQTHILEPDALAQRYPWLQTAGVAAGCASLAGEGWIDPFALLRAFRAKARSLGVRYRDDRCTGIERTGMRVTALHTQRSGPVRCGTAVIAAGPWSGAVAAMASVDLPVRPRKRNVFVFDCRTNLSACPLTVDPSGVYFRPEGTRFLCGWSPPAEQDRDREDLGVDHGEFERDLWPVLAARVPAFEAVKVTGAWAGLYDYNILDQNAVIGAHPEVRNLIVASGFSGHGLQQSPAAGRAVAELIVQGRFVSLDLRRFGWERILENQPIREAHVI